MHPAQRQSTWIRQIALVPVLLAILSVAHAEPLMHVSGYQVELLAKGIGAATGMALEDGSDLYVTDYAGFRVLRVRNPASRKPGLPEVVATNVAYPTDIAFAFGSRPAKKNPTRALVASPTGPSSNIVELLPNGALATFATGFSYPLGLAVFGDYPYVGNSGDGTISKVGFSGAKTTFLSGFSGPNGPFGLDFDRAGNLYFVVHGTGRVYRANPTGATQDIGGVAAFGGVFVAALPQGRGILVSDVLQAAVYLIDEQGTRLFASGFAGKSRPPFNGPNDMAIDSAREIIYVADADNVWRISKARGEP